MDNGQDAKEAISFVFRTSRMVIGDFIRAAGAVSRKHEKNKQKREMKRNSGKQPVKRLIKQGQGVTTIPLDDSSVKDFQKIARKYGLDFSIVKDKSVDPPMYTVFCKAKDMDVISHMLDDYTKKRFRGEKGAERPSILKKLEKMKEKVASLPKKMLEKRKVMER